MSTKQDQTKGSIVLIDIQDREVLIIEPEEHFIRQFERDNLKLGLKTSFEIKDEGDRVFVHMGASYEYNDADKERTLMKAAFTFQYSVSNLQEIAIKNDSDKTDEVSLPDDLALTLLSISLSTMRGLIAAKSRGYFINKFYIPIVNPKQLASKLSQ